MPKRTDLNKILIIGSGPIVIGQACEFDYSGTQACKSLKEEGYQVVLVNSNPATIMTDPEIADATYVEPITPDIVAKIIEKERPEAVLPTLGGQTGLNTAVKLYEMGVLEKLGVEMIGASYHAIQKAEDRDLFKKCIQNIGLDLPESGLAYTLDEAIEKVKGIGFPSIIRPSFTLGGTGGGFATNMSGFKRIASSGLENSLISEILIEESITGWKEYELEVMRDRNDNVVIVCSIENLDPMGIHTGDSITVAPAQTLSDKEYQIMRDAAAAIIREIGVDTGGSNIQFATNPQTGRMVVIEMNPRVSRSSALASKATGFPIAKFAAKLAVGYTLDEISNDITRETPASFEPAIDYCVVKIPRFTFEKFPEADSTLGISMKSVGETMSIGRTFKESLQKGLRGLEVGYSGLDNKEFGPIYTLNNKMLNNIEKHLERPNAERIMYIKKAFQNGFSIDEIFKLTHIDRWFLHNIKEIVEFEIKLVQSGKLHDISKDLLLESKRLGFSDVQLAEIFKTDEITVRKTRKSKDIKAIYKLVDTCAAEFEAYTPYYYSTYESEDEIRPASKKQIMILGGGPNRIGQGIEFDYCCCHASFALKELGFETIMVNCNPETVSTDYDTSDKLYFEPLTFEDVMNIIDKEKPDGVIVQFGGQTPLNLARRLSDSGATIIGTSVESIDRAEDREQFKILLEQLDLKQSPNGIANSFAEADKAANIIGYPVLVRPSYVLGGRAMKIVYSREELENYIRIATEASPERPILIDKFLENAIEVDVDAISDGKHTVIGGIMEHIEEAGVHSGDSACSLPPFSIGDKLIEEIRQSTYALSKKLKVIGLMNIQYAIRKGMLFVLEVNPRASRTIPFVSKATGVPLAKLAAKVMAGKTLHELGFTNEIKIKHNAVKESVLPFSRFSGVDPILGPEMKSTGEVMGIANSFGIAFAKAQMAANQSFPNSGTVFISVKDSDKRDIIFVAKKIEDMGFKIIATYGTAKVLRTNGIDATSVKKVLEGTPNIVDFIKEGRVGMVINTPSGAKPHQDEIIIRSSSVMHSVPYITTLAGAQASVNGIEAVKRGHIDVAPLQSYYGRFK
ncbi:MAG: carbamoyl-phosphate synthase large subunit [Candidatus Theseobacter exili]|nr:carbamoyl-phosphate synthase large subunit [Candidatus Theseobacter exili]